MKVAPTYDATKLHESVFFETDEDIVARHNAALEDGDSPFSLLSLATWHARGMAQLAREASRIMRHAS